MTAGGKIRYGDLTMHWRATVSFGFLAWALSLAITVAPASARQEAHIILDYDRGEVLASSKADERAYPASLTKMMTLYLTFRALEAGQIKMSTRLKVSRRAAAMPPTKLGLKPGSRLKVEDAVLGLVTRSANDAAAVLAEALGGSESRFALLMTRTARRLGMSRTAFKNASGLPDREQVSTARDMSRLASRLIKDFPQYYPYFARERFVLAGRTYANHNRLMQSYRGMDGLKTGYTRASGFNLTASAERDGRRLVAVVLGGKTAGARDARMAAILDDGFTELARRPALVAMIQPSPPKPAIAAALYAAAAEKGADADEGAEVVVASLADATAVAAPTAVLTDVPVPEPRAVTEPAVKPAALRKAPAAVVNATSVAKRKAIAAARAQREPATSSGLPFGVQVGAFSEPDAARTAAKRAIRYAPDLLRGTFVSVSSLAAGGRRLYRATLVGLDEQEAALACRLLERQRQDCMVVQATAALTLARR